MHGKRNKSLFRILTAGFFVVAVTVGALFVFGSGDGSISKAGAQARKAPDNPEFVRHLYRRMAGESMVKFTKDGHPLGQMPCPLDPAIFRAQPESAQQYPKTSLVAKFDLRVRNKLTPIKNQGQCGSCWAFATYGSLESSFMPLKAWNFSENDLINKAGFDYGPCEGGFYTMSAAYLARWAGPANEVANPYPYYSPHHSPNGYPTWKHVQNMYALIDRKGPLDNLKIKSAVIKYGAVGVNMCWYDDSYNSATASYFYKGTENDNGHAVCVVGWDDNFPKTNFAVQPAGNGAFIVRNSWGEDWGEGGYFYVSYYDKFFGRRGSSNFAAAFTGEPLNNYRTNYGHDQLGWCYNLRFNNSSTGWFSNVFKAKVSGNIKAVSFYTASNTNNYTIWIYTNVTAGKPTSGTKFAKIKTGTLKGMGYQTVPLGFLVPITAGKNFSVVVKLVTVGYNYPIPVEAKITGYSSKASILRGQSFLSGDGKKWYDVLDTWADFELKNVCLRAFTKY